MSEGWNNHATKCPAAKGPGEELSGGDISNGEMSGHRIRVIWKCTFCIKQLNLKQHPSKTAVSNCYLSLLHKTQPWGYVNCMIEKSGPYQMCYFKKVCHSNEMFEGNTSECVKLCHSEKKLSIFNALSFKIYWKIRVKRGTPNSVQKLG